MYDIWRCNKIESQKLKEFYTNGYKCYYLPNHHLANKTGYVYEHLLVAEEILQRELNRDEVVHHKDLNKKNNCKNNLMVFATKGDHTAFHNSGLDEKYLYIKNGVYYFKSYKNICPICHGYKDIKANVCRQCYLKQKANNIPSEYILKKLIDKFSLTQIGKKYGVSDRAVYKWCKKYGISSKK